MSFAINFFLVIGFWYLIIGFAVSIFIMRYLQATHQTLLWDIHRSQGLPWSMRITKITFQMFLVVAWILVILDLDYFLDDLSN